jgi:hypothetical protein
MLDILHNLEPRLFEPDTIICSEKEAVTEHLYLKKGIITVGFVEEITKN